MKLYTFQSLDVAAKLHRDIIFFGDWNKLNYQELVEPYSWMLRCYNKKKGHDFSGPPIFWYTDLKDALNRIKRGVSPQSVLLIAEVPESVFLLHDFETWHFVLNNCGAGFQGVVTDKREEEIYKAYERNHRAMEETWNEVFNIPKRDKNTSAIHAVTPYINKTWITD